MKKQLLRILALCAACALLFALVGCGSSGQGGNQTSGQSGSQTSAAQEKMYAEWDQVVDNNTWDDIYNQAMGYYTAGGTVNKQKLTNMATNFWDWAKARGYGTTWSEIEQSLGYKATTLSTPFAAGGVNQPGNTQGE